MDTIKLYVSGPMAGYPEHNYPAFAFATDRLRKVGFEVISPAELGKVDGWEWSDYLRRDIKVLMDCTDVATLNFWQDSQGASLEVEIAQRLGMRTRPYEWWVWHREGEDF